MPQTPERTLAIIKFTTVAMLAVFVASAMTLAVSTKPSDVKSSVNALRTEVGKLQKQVEEIREELKEMAEK